MINRMHKARYDSRPRRSVETRLTPAPLPIANASLVYSGDPEISVVVQQAVPFKKFKSVRKIARCGDFLCLYLHISKKSLSNFEGTDTALPSHLETTVARLCSYTSSQPTKLKLI